MKKFKRGDRVIHIRDNIAGVVVSIKERGVAGSDVTYIEKIEVQLDNGMILFDSPDCFRADGNE